MKRLLTLGCREWCHSRGYRGNSPGEPADLPRRKLIFEVPTTSRVRIEVARCISDWLPRGTALLWVTDWPLYLPDEMLLFKTLFPHDEELIKAPGLEFTEAAEDRDRMTFAIYLLFAFNWQAYLLASGRCPVIWLADEVVEARSEDGDALVRLAGALQSYGVRVFE